MIAAEDARLISSEGTVSKPVSWQTMYNAFNQNVTGSTWAWGVMGGTVAQRSNDAMSADWERKQLADQKMIRGSGDGAGGFIYFRRNKGTPPFTLQLVVEKLRTSETVTIELALPSGASAAAE